VAESAPKRRSGWARGAEQYRRNTPQARSSDRDLFAADPSTSTPCGITWDASRIDFDALQPTTVARALARLRGAHAEIVWDAAVQEGSPYTLPEVQTLLEGVTAGGHQLHDQSLVLALHDAFRHLETLVEQGSFRFDRATSSSLHGLVARAEALEAGHFRGELEGGVNGGGTVRLGEHGHFEATASGPELALEFDQAMAYLGTLDVPERAIAYFATAAYRQFYFDGNKRTGRLMMSGELLSHGYDSISIPAARRIEFHTHLRAMYVTGDATDLMAFVVDCRSRG